MAKTVANWQVKIYTNWRRYKKLIPAVVGVSLLVLLKYLDIDLPGFSAIVLDWLIGGATVFGVYQVKNEQKADAVTIETEVTQTGSKK